MALGLNSLLLGSECFLLDRVELSKSFTTAIIGRETASAVPTGAPISANIYQNSGYQYQSSPDSNALIRGRSFKPREWMPWSLLAAGAIIVMYAGSGAASSRKSA